MTWGLYGCCFGMITCITYLHHELWMIFAQSSYLYRSHLTHPQHHHIEVKKFKNLCKERHEAHDFIIPPAQPG